jgi:DNA polymerase-4/DNA polymerase IV (DinB-like DNA polymerase)
LNDVLFLLSLCVFHRAKRVGLYGNGVSLKITYSNMKTITRSQAISYCDSPAQIFKIAESMFEKVEKQPIRLIGVSIYNLSSKFIGQLTFDSFWEEKNNNKEDIIEQKLELLNDRYHLDFAGNLDKIFHGITLYKTIEYMRKHI